MATDPRNALKSFARLDQQKKEDDKLAYQFKVVKIIAKELELDMSAIMHEYHAVKEESPELFLQAIKESSANFPETLFIESKHPTKFDALALKAQDTHWFKRFLAIASDNNLVSAGLIFPVMGRKDWIIHNIPVAPESGKVRLFIPSATYGVDSVHITTLTQFLREYKNPFKGV